MDYLVLSSCFEYCIKFIPFLSYVLFKKDCVLIYDGTWWLLEEVESVILQIILVLLYVFLLRKPNCQ